MRENVPVPDDLRLRSILTELSGPQSECAWTELVELYSPVLNQVTRLFAADYDEASDAFVWICEALRANSFERLRQYRSEGAAQFATWLRVVARNLCIDWHRRRYGRRRRFHSVARLNDLERSIFRAVLIEGRTYEETAVILGTRYAVTEMIVASVAERLRCTLTARQKRAIAVQRIRLESLDDQAEFAAPDLDPETLAIESEVAAKFDRAMSQLDTEAALLLRLRYEQGLTLSSVASLTGLKDAQTADRRIRQVLERLHEFMHAPPGKVPVESVKEGSAQRDSPRGHVKVAGMPG
jgi:RNA polymerase sigma factor (sigma-70 family)